MLERKTKEIEIPRTALWKAVRGRIGRSIAL